ncbi:MAG: response regulator [Cyclobacteriaceae bacterium]
MDIIKVMIVEDEWIVSEEIKEVLEYKGFEVVGQAEDGDSAIKLMNANPADIVLMDIQIGGPYDGIELAERIKKKHACAIIFLTANAKEHHVERAKQIKPAAYIIKPFQEKNLEMAIEMAINNRSEKDTTPKAESYIISDHIFIRDSGRYKRIALEQIYYVNAVGSYIEIITKDQKLTLAVNLKAFEARLSDSRFLRIHRSHLINLNQIEEYDGVKVYLGGEALPIGNSYKDEFLLHIKFL